MRDAAGLSDAGGDVRACLCDSGAPDGGADVRALGGARHTQRLPRRDSAVPPERGRDAAVRRVRGRYIARPPRAFYAAGGLLLSPPEMLCLMPPLCFGLFSSHSPNAFLPGAPRAPGSRGKAPPRPPGRSGQAPRPQKTAPRFRQNDPNRGPYLCGRPNLLTFFDKMRRKMASTSPKNQVRRPENPVFSPK